jgi:hypothetical protein
MITPIVLAIEVLRRQTAREFPTAQGGEAIVRLAGSRGATRMALVRFERSTPT